MNIKNYVQLEFFSRPENVSFARSSVGAFAAQLNCTLNDIEEIKLVVSEAVSNSIIHGYHNRPYETVVVTVSIGDEGTLEITVQDNGCGIENVEQAMQPAFSTEESRMGMGFTFMQSFMDQIEVISEVHKGTTVRLKRHFTLREEADA